MASIYSTTTEGERALTAATAKTLITLIGATAVKARIVELGIAFDSTSSSAEPVRVRLVRATADGTGTAATVKAWDPDNPTASATSKYNYSAEPTKESQALCEWQVHPQAGIVVQYPLGREPVLDNATTSILCLEATAPAAVNSSAYLVWEE